ncbi:CPBP family intramembrane glutamic endopeptidase [Nocardioides iriomotensis]|uniref:CPBP family intramembrane metalloprotease n=1 Tax=Nocardioides iriomotensis TaxID=715784 RepID=A0A4Q5IUD5_9ACTN|nr:CPBP family intramembrane glutamic endopeptidase [Nocardioides iriomotensis]RYU09524.1 CPBP family intramembrane metalloprotease [Nocardioides iriomotensis]
MTTKAETSPSGGTGARPPGRSGRRPWWTVLTLVEVAAATVAVVADWFIPSLVLVVMAGVSLVVRRQRPSSLGFHRPAHPWRLAGRMLAFAAGWTLLNVALLIPVTNHLSGQRQDVSAFAHLEGDLGLLAAYLVLSWVVAALAEETAFRGYLLTRLRDLLGGGRAAVVAAVVLSSALFGLLHTEQGVVGVVASALGGVVFALLRLWTGTLWAPVLAHGFDDTIGFVWFYLFGPFYGLW